jgi:PKD repeat protein
VTGEFIWWTNYDQAGTYKVTFTASDGSLSDEETITITVVDVNPPPELLPIGDLSVDEGWGIDIGIYAYDPDNDTITYSASPMPDGATIDPVTGEFIWWTNYDQAGTYKVTFTASDGSLSDEETITITVVDVNPPPELLPIGDLSVDEGWGIDIGIYAYDPDNDTITYSAGPLPDGATIDPVTGEFIWWTNYDQAGTYKVTFTASDGSLSDEEIVAITVIDVNPPPELSQIGDKVVEEGSGLDFGIYAYDPNGDIVTYAASPLPDGATFYPTGEFVWWPTYGQAGTYQVTFTASDGSFSDDETITITVTEGNPPPELSPIGAMTVEEGSWLDFAISAYDPNGDTITYSADPLPDGATFDPVSGSFFWAPAGGQTGKYQVTFTASDGFNTDEETIIITVKSKIISGSYLAGGGYLVMTGSAGELSATPGTKNFFGLFVPYNKRGGPQLGLVSVIFRNNGHVFRARSLIIDTLSVDPKTGIATLTSRATLQDITKPKNPVIIERNAALKLTLTDTKNTGAKDSIGITLNKKDGGLWFSSNWNGKQTVEQVLDRGILVIH